MSSGRFVLRVTVGGLMLGHGLQKLNGSFGGPGLEATGTPWEPSDCIRPSTRVWLRR